MYLFTIFVFLISIISFAVMMPSKTSNNGFQDQQNKIMKMGRDMSDYSGLMEDDNQNEDDSNVRHKRNVRLSGKWDPSGIPYTVDNAFTTKERKMISAAIEEFHKYTCIKFINKTNEHDYLEFRKSDQHGACWSSGIGKNHPNYQPQYILFRVGCLDKLRYPLHEIMHALGFFHEVTRPDRDQYVTIHEDNVKDGYLEAFDLQLDADTLGAPYDYGSIMHCKSTRYSKNKTSLLTVEPKDTAWTDKMGHAKVLSQLDVEKINLLYCDGVNPGPPINTCIDTHAYCASWKDRCRYSEQVVDWCPETCNQCSDPPGPLPCGNNYSNCDEYEAHCDSTLSGWQWVAQNCHLTCDTC